MNNIFLPNDPLLFNNQQADYRQLYEQKLLKEREIFDKHYEEYMKSIQTIPKQEDKLAELNDTMNGLSIEIKNELQQNKEFVELHQTLQEYVQAELVQLVKKNVNGNADMVGNINKQIQIINQLSEKIKDQDRKNMAQINDYLQNYSDMTFDEYKKLKNI